MVKKKLVFAGSVTTRSGYGARARDIAHALIDSDKYDVSIIPLRWGATPQDALNPDDEHDAKIIRHITSGQLDYQPDVFIHLTIPNEFQKVGKFNIGITAGIETTVCKPEWIEGCNRMDLVLTSSNHSKAVFKSVRYDKRNNTTGITEEVLSVNRPVEVLFEGVDLNVFNKTPNVSSDVYKDISAIPEQFCFLFVGHWLQGDLGNDRKDIGMLIKVFLDTFKQKSKKNKPALILKTSMASFSEPERSVIVKKIQDIRTLVRNEGHTGALPNIYLLYGGISDAEMNDLYNHPKVKAMVSFAHGEGFGRPLLEFTMSGKPVITSGWSGPLDFLHPQYSVLLAGGLEPVHPSAVNEWIVEGSQWFRVNYPAASGILSSVYDKYDKYLELSRKHRKHTTDNFSLDKMGNMLCDFIDRVEEYSGTVSSQAEPQRVPLKLPKLQMVNPPADKLTLPKLKRV